MEKEIVGESCAAGRTWFGMGLFLCASVLCCALDGEEQKEPKTEKKERTKRLI